MRCAVSFLTVVVLSSAVGVMALLIILLTNTQDFCEVVGNGFRCLTNGRCLKPDQVCNKLHDCPDGSDELPYKCNDMSTLEHHINIMLGMGNGTDCTPKNIHDNNDREEVDQESLERKRNHTKQNGLMKKPEICQYIIFNVSSPPKGVICRGKDMMNSSLDIIPWKEIDSQALQITIDLGAVNTSLLRAAPSGVVFHLLQRMYLTDNYIAAIDDGVFCNFPVLEHLFLSNNQIQNISQNAFCRMSILRILHLNNNNLHLNGFRFQNMSKLKTIYLDNNQIEEIDEFMFGELHYLKMLQLSNNRISVIHENAFVNNTCLKELDLSSNRLHRVSPLLLRYQTKLIKLYMTKNPKIKLPYELFRHLESLVSLNIDTLELDQFDIRSFNFTPMLDIVYFKRFSYCRFTPRAHRCYPYSDGLSSNSNLLIGQSRVMVWLVGILTVLGNVSVLANRWILRRRSAGRSEITEILNIFVTNLAIADLLMGLYLLVLGCKDVHFRGLYSVKAYEWGTSILCSVIGMLALISSEVSLLILTLMSMERYLTIRGPFTSRHNLNVNLARASMLVIWVFVGILAIAPAIQWQNSRNTGFYGSTGLCFPLGLDERYPIGWQYTTFVFIGVNSCCLVLITVSYALLYYTVRNTQRKTPLLNKNIELAFRFFLMVFTDMLCWIPIILLKSLVLGGYELSNELIGWTIIYVLPLNSAVNPILYTFSTNEVRLAIKTQVNRMLGNLELNRMIPTSQGNSSMELQCMPRSIFGGSRSTARTLDQEEQPNTTGTVGTEDTELTHSACPTVVS